MTEQDFKFEDVKKYLLQMPIVFFSTMEKKQPRVRPMALIHCDNEFWLTSRSYEEKIAQVKDNEYFVFYRCALVSSYRLAISRAVRGWSYSSVQVS